MEPADVFGNIKQGETYSPASKMIDDWYAVEAIDAQTFAVNEPYSAPVFRYYPTASRVKKSIARVAGTRTVTSMRERRRCRVRYRRLIGFGYGSGIGAALG